MSELAKTPIHHLKIGSGPPLLLLHGLFDTGQTWDRLVPQLSDRFTLYAIDLPGFGKTPLPKRWSNSFSAMVDAVLGFLDKQGIAKISLVGNSMGGSLSLAICEAAPKRVDRIILLNPFGLPQVPVAVKSARSLMGRLLPYLLLEPAIRQCAKVIFSRALFDKDRLTSEALEQRVEPFASLQQRRNLFRFLREISTETIKVIDDKVPSILQPVLILWGKEDGWLSQDHWMHLKDRLPNARVQLFPDCGHLPQIEKPEDVATTIVAFLSESNRNSYVIP